MTAQPPTPPRATMRLQLHKDFTFADAAKILPYVAQLGISHIYASPILTARPGSIHGYDVIDPTKVNAELGGEDGLRAFVAALRALELGLIVDIVPNHMAVGAAENPWWVDVLKLGRRSRYSDFFDIDWQTNRPGLRDKVLAPFLGKPYGAALADGELRLRALDSTGYAVDYFGNLFPIRPEDEAHIQEAGLESFDPATSGGREMIHSLLERQHYRLAWWTTAGDEINWRRFFDINGLAGLRIEDPPVFEAAHATLFRLYAEGLIDGFRVDHVDGLTDPPAYCRRLRQRLNELQAQRPPAVPNGPAYLVVEKILARDEKLPTDWQVDGTTGYDFMNEVNAVQHDPSAQKALSELWRSVSGRSAGFAPEEQAARRQILARSFDAALQSVVDTLYDLARRDLRTRDLAAAAIRRGLIDYLAHFPVYRGYTAGGQRSNADQWAFTQALEHAKLDTPLSAHSLLDQIDRWLGGEPVRPDDGPLRRRATALFNQLSAPLAAKAVEDTAFYRYGRLLSRNDVGFDAARLGSTVGDFHAACLSRLQSFPDAMLATATHDHKRGEDVRARLAVLSEVPDQWADLVARALTLPSAARPDPGDEVMLYQMLIGAWPLDLDDRDTAGRSAFAERVAGWLQKALREAKRRSDWIVPNEEYEQRARDFLFEATSNDNPRTALLRNFIHRISAAGAVNGLVQAALKLTVPGMPDFFQGTEFWDFSLVDPDNRRPVDFARRQGTLGDAPEPTAAAATWRDGRVKQSLIHRLLSLRSDVPDLFARGDYLPVVVKGALADHVIAFARCAADTAAIVLAPRLPMRLMQSQDSILLQANRLPDLSVVPPAQLAGRKFTNVLCAEASPAPGAELALAPLLGPFPVAVLRCG